MNVHDKLNRVLPASHTFDPAHHIIRKDNETFHYFYGCGYHDIQDRPELRTKIISMMHSYGFKQGASHYELIQNTKYQELIDCATHFFHTEEALIFPSGYLGNTLVIQALSDEFDLIFLDAESHYSMRDGVAISGKQFFYYQHLDHQDLAMKLKTHLQPGQTPLIACDGVFPFSGAISPIDKILEILDDLGRGYLLIDDAHGTGVLGDHGRGIREHFQIDHANTYITETMSKAIGSHGGIIAHTGSKIQKLKNGSHINIGATQIPYPTMEASIFGFNLLMNHPEMITQLHANALYLKEGFRKLGFPISINPSGMVCIPQIHNISLEKLHQFYKKHHIWANFAKAGSYTSVPPSGGIKFTIFSTHTQDQLDHVLAVTKRFLNKNQKLDDS